MRIATRQGWQALPMPDESSKITFEREYSMREFERLRAGLVPQEMEDRWFVYFEDPYLYLHRSWSGFCIYRVRFDQSDTRARVVEVVVNRRHDQYGGTDDYDGVSVGILLDTLAGRDTRAEMLNHVRGERTAPVSSAGEIRLLITYALTLLLGMAVASGASWLVGFFWAGVQLPVFLVVASLCLWIAWRNAKTRDRSA